MQSTMIKKHIIVVALSIYVRSVLLIKGQTYQQNGLGYLKKLDSIGQRMIIVDDNGIETIIDTKWIYDIV